MVPLSGLTLSNKLCILSFFIDFFVYPNHFNDKRIKNQSFRRSSFRVFFQNQLKFYSRPTQFKILEFCSFFVLKIVMVVIGVFHPA